jgi:hypothetical protein
MQLMTFNSLLMFDIVFIFFLFLVAVTCLLYYLPPTKVSRHRAQSDKRRVSQQSVTVASSNISKSVLYVNSDNEPVESFIKCCKYCEKCKLIYEEIYSERCYMSESNDATTSKKASTSNVSYLKAKDCDIKNCKGPIYEV